MGALVLAGILLVVAVVVWFLPLNEEFSRFQRVATVLIGVLSTTFAVVGGTSYNDAGICVHIRTIFGKETVKCDLGWYFSGWGQTTEWPHYITVSHTQEATEGSVSDLPLYTIRMADNWSGQITQTTRFGIPQDESQFLKMARDFRTPERMIVTTLRPAVTSSLDSVANLFTMEEYWSGGKRDEFKTEFEEAIKKGRPAIDRVEMSSSSIATEAEIAPSDSEFARDTSETGEFEVTRMVTKKRLDASGIEIRIPHDYIDYGILVSSAIVEQLNPDDRFEERIQERKEAASRRIIAREKRLEEEEQRLLAITKSEREIAERQGQARVEQIEKTTNAETEKKLALTAAERQREEAKIAQQTAQISLDRARIDAEAVRVTAEAEAYKRQKALEADNALQAKIDAEIAIQKVWAEAFAQRKVPTVVMGGNGSTGTDSDVQTFMDMLTIDAAKRLAYDRAIAQ